MVEFGEGLELALEAGTGPSSLAQPVGYHLLWRRVKMVVPTKPAATGAAPAAGAVPAAGGAAKTPMTKTVLHSLSGQALAGTVTAIMGPVRMEVGLDLTSLAPRS